MCRFLKRGEVWRGGELLARSSPPLQGLTLPRQERHISEHVFGENAVSRGGIVDQDVRHRTHNLPILDDRGAAHSLNDTARDREQVGVGHGHGEAFRTICVAVDIRDLYVVAVDLVGVERREDIGVTLFDLVVQRHGHRLAVKRGNFRKDTPNAAGRVPKERANLSCVKEALQLPGRAGCAAYHRADGHVGDGSAPHGDQLARVGVADPVAKPRKGTCVGQNKGDRADPRAAVAHPDARLIARLGGAVYGSQRDVKFVSTTSTMQSQCVAAAVFDQVGQLRSPQKSLAVDLQDHILLFQPRVGGGVDLFTAVDLHVAKTDHRHTVGVKLDAKGHSAGVEEQTFQRLGRKIGCGISVKIRIDGKGGCFGHGKCGNARGVMLLLSDALPCDWGCGGKGNGKRQQQVAQER